MVGGFIGAEFSGAIAHRILIVEDDPEQALVLREILQEHGYMAQIAKDGGQAHSAMTMNRPDFVLLDVILPGESGFEICDRIKQRDSGIPVVMMSAVSLDDAKDLAKRVGADAYLVKPFDPETLLALIPEIAQQVWERGHLQQPKDESRIRFSCRCGKRFKMSPTHRGRTLTCPDCGEPLMVPFHE